MPVLIPQTPKGVEHIAIRSVPTNNRLVLIPQTPKGVEHECPRTAAGPGNESANSSDAQRR